MLKYNEGNVILTTSAWTAYKERAAANVNADQLDKFLLNHIKVQLNCLRFRAGVRFGKLPRLSTGGRPYPLNHVQNAYEVLLRKFDADKFQPKPVVKSVEDRMMSEIDSFREGTLTDEAKAMQSERRGEILSEIERAKQERAQDVERSRSTGRVRSQRECGSRRGRGRRRGEGRREFADMKGKRVRVPSTYFGLNDGDVYGGVVGPWTRYMGGDFNEYWGYNILYDLGDQYCMIESDVKLYLAEDAVDSVGVGSSPEIRDEVEVKTVREPSVEEDVESDLYLGNGAAPEWLIDT